MSDRYIGTLHFLVIQSCIRGCAEAASDRRPLALCLDHKLIQADATIREIRNCITEFNEFRSPQAFYCSRSLLKIGVNLSLRDTMENHMSVHKGRIYDNILQVIGNTPLVRLNRIPKDYGIECEMYAKCEFLNPGGSIKDRISYSMVLDAEERGLAKAGTRFVEPTSGNTGIGVSLAAAVGGYGCTIVTPDKNSDEKMSTISLLGAEVVQTPAMAPYGAPENFVSVAERLLKENPNAISLDQYTNDVNPRTHYEHTAEEILSSVGELDMIVIGAGTGGTVAGVARKIKERCPHCIVVAVDPQGSVMFQNGKPKLFFVEGIGGDFIPKVLDKSLVDKVDHPNDYEAFNMCREIIRKEGLLCGGSSGAAMCSAIRAIRELKLGAGARVVVILPDGIRNYMTKFVCDQWMEAHLFKEPPQRNYKWWNKSISHLNIDRTVPRVSEEASVQEALDVMGSKHDIALVLGCNQFLKGVISKKSIRSGATNPKQKGESLDLNNVVSRHLVKTYYKIVENTGRPTVGLAARILDIAPFVVIVEELKQDNDMTGYIPKGIVTDDIMVDFIVKHQNSL